MTSAPRPVIVQRFEAPDALTDPAALSRLLGPVEAVVREPLHTSGFSGSSHERLDVRLASGPHRALVLKRTPLDRDFTAYRTGDRAGREALLLQEPGLARVWEVFASPYLAFATAPGEVALLMEDVSAHLFPDVRAPLSAAEERHLLAAIARFHARFWDAPGLDHSGLARAASLIDMLGPGIGEQTAGRPPHPVTERARAGWEVALRRLPRNAAGRMLEPAESLVRSWNALPRTLLHGDVKVANFAMLPEGRVAAFDWSCAAAGPPAIDVGWYLAVNASRLAGTKEATLALYRELLEAERAVAIPEDEWRGLVAAAVQSGARMLLWSKALALETGGERARQEWDWWVGNLERG